MPRLILIFKLFMLAGLVTGRLFAAEFIHPGLLHSQADLDRIKQKVHAGEEPWKSGYQIFQIDSASQAKYRMRGPAETIGRAPNVNFVEFDQDANAAYQIALMWAITGDRVYAVKSMEIIDAWSRTLKQVTGRDAVLMAGLGPFKMINAAEILRYTDASWPDSSIRQAERMFLEAIYPTVKDFALFANGNWDIAAMQTVMAIGVFCNDRAIFERGLRYYVDGAGNGRLTHYVVNAVGQCQESGRDQQHTQLGLAMLSACCEIAWQQGLDLYAYSDYRLLNGFEYTAQYNLGDDVPFTDILDRTGKYHHTRISDQGRGHLRAIYEQVYNHYVNRADLDAPWTRKAAEKIRPEGPGHPGADHPGFGTLLYSRSTQSNNADGFPQPPAGLVGHGSTQQIKLTWVSSVYADRYIIKRATRIDGPYTIIADNIAAPTYVDSTVDSGQLYTYTVCAVNANGQSRDAFPVSVCAGLPASWSCQDIGETTIPGQSAFDGERFILTGSGRITGADDDQMHFAFRSMTGDGVIMARYIPPFNSQTTMMGPVMRESLDSSSDQVALIIMPVFGRNVEAPGWYARVSERSKTGEQSQAQPGVRLNNPAVSHGRLTGPCWLRLERKGNTFTGSTSYDGTTWILAGQTTVSLNNNLYVGLAVCSGRDDLATQVQFDHVTLKPDR